MYNGEFAPHLRQEQERRLRRSHHAGQAWRRRKDWADLDDVPRDPDGR